MLRPDGGLDNALAQRQRDLAHLDARTVVERGFAEAPGVLHNLAAHLAGLEPCEADVKLLCLPNGWAMPSAMPAWLDIVASQSRGSVPVRFCVDVQAQRSVSMSTLSEWRFAPVPQ